VKSNPNYEFVGMYADEGITGTLVKNRTEFKRMIEDAMNGKIDMIMAKSISRFARNTLDTLKYCRDLREKNVDVYFEKENIHTTEMKTEMFLTFYSAFAQAESESISENVKIGVKAKMVKGDYIGQARCYGYNWNKDKKMLEINEEEAKVVKMIFNWYVDGIGSYRIAKKLNKLNIPNYYGRKWNYGSIKKMITNEKYVGDLMSGKAYVVDPISHKKVWNYGEKAMYYTKDKHEPIISRDIWDECQAIYKKRGSILAPDGHKHSDKFSKRYTFSSRIKCGYCGANFTRQPTNKKNGATRWRCHTALVYRDDCIAKSVSETYLTQMFVELFNQLSSKIEKDDYNLLNTIRQSLNEEFDANKLNSLNKEKEKISKRLLNLVDLTLDGTLDREVYKEKQKELNKSLKEIQNRIDSYEDIKKGSKNLEERLNIIKEVLNKNQKIKEFDEVLFDKLIDRIIIGEEVNGEFNHNIIRFVLKIGADEKFLIEKNNDNKCVCFRQYGLSVEIRYKRFD